MSRPAASGASLALAGLGAGTCIALAGVVLAQRRRIIGLRAEARTRAKERDAERAGRVNVERELRAFVASALQPDGAYFFAPIAVVRSCFKECVGTPRQGQFAPSTRATVVFDRSSVSPDALSTLEEFSHVWIFWAFHLNTNGKAARAHAGVRPDSGGHTFLAKVTPPFLKRRVGVLATRSPHRPNPIGVSLCRVHSVDALARLVSLTGVDLVEGTPVLDLKPYVPAYDRPEPLVAVAGWVAESVRHRRRVEWTAEAEEQLEALAPALKLYRGERDAARR